jgi:hypothetical protein
MKERKVSPYKADPRKNQFGIFLEDYSHEFGTLWYSSTKAMIEDMNSGEIYKHFSPSPEALQKLLKNVTTWEQLCKKEKILEKIIFEKEGSDWEYLKLIHWSEATKSKSKTWIKIRELFELRFDIDVGKTKLTPRQLNQFIKFLRSSLI